MKYSEVSDLPVIEETEARGEVADILEEYKRVMQSPDIPNIMLGLAVSPAALKIQWDLFKSIFTNTNLPESIIFMILYTVAEANNCGYCSASNELSCRTLGIDEATIKALVEDLDHLNPQRVREIIRFAINVSQDPIGLVAEDYDRMRDAGISDAEIVEIIQIASLSNYTNTLTDALKIDIDAKVKIALER